MANRFDDIEELFDRHARRLARDLGGLIVEVGEALRRASDTETLAPPPRTTRADKAEPTRDDLYREATRLGVPGRSKMSKEQLRVAVKRAKTSR